MIDHESSMIRAPGAWTVNLSFVKTFITRTAEVNFAFRCCGTKSLDTLGLDMAKYI